MLLRDRLKPGGLAVTWAPTPRIQRTFLKVFPHVVGYGDILLGSRDPIIIDAARIRARLDEPGVREYYADASVDIVALLDRYLAQSPQMFDERHDGSTIADINTDLFPRDEFDVPAFSMWWSQHARAGQ